MVCRVTRRGIGLGLVVMTVAAACAAAPGLVVAQELEGSFERTLDVTGRIDLEVMTGAGSIAVRTGASGTVRIEGRIQGRESSRYSEREIAERIRAIEQDPPIEQRGNVIRVGDLDEAERRGLKISYELVVPANASLEAHSGSGSQTIGDLDGPVEASAGSGSITIGEIRDDVRATAGSGSIRIRSARGEVRVRTGSGSIRAVGVAGSIDSSSGSGSVELEQTGPGDATIKTGSGSVNIHGTQGALRVQTGSGSITAEGEPEGTWRLQASSGSISVRLPSEAAFDLEARTTSGRVQSRHPVMVVGSLGGRELRGEVRGGGHLVQLITSSGSIRIE